MSTPIEDAAASPPAADPLSELGERARAQLDRDWQTARERGWVRPKASRADFAAGWITFGRLHTWKGRSSRPAPNHDVAAD